MEKSKELSALGRLKRRFAVIEPNVHILEKGDISNFTPSVIEGPGDWVKQSVHFIMSDGYVRFNAVPYVKNTWTNCCEDPNATKVKDRLSSSVSFVAVLVDCREKRELLVYPVASIKRKCLKNY